jgi:5-methylcytosine-specific restriction endonuclease McrA
MTIDRSYRFKSEWRRGQRQRILARDGGCRLCGNTGSDGKGRGLAQAHLEDAGPGVPNDDSNVVLLCPPCHRRFDAAKQRARRAT